MDFENAKENIQPLASGRNASILTSSLTYHSELQKQREILENAIHNYEGEDPLEPWYEYILWVEQSYPSGGNESGLKKLLLKCLTTFEDDKKYYQDRRLIRIFIKYIDTEENPVELYQELFNSGIGTMIADLYICWAYYYDLVGNFHKADSIFRKGIEVKAQPYEELEQAYKHFGFTMSQRILHQDETSKEEMMTSIRERRHALTSLRPHKKKVGSIRTGSAVKSSNPGKIKINDKNESFANNRNARIQIFEDQNINPNLPLNPPEIEEHHIPVVKNIIDSVRKKENLKEPGPWTKGLKKRGHLFDHAKSQEHEIGFTILEDDKESEGENSRKLSSKKPQVATPFTENYEDNFSKGIQLPKNFAKQNYPQGIWKVEIIADNEVLPGTFPQYNKLFHYPKPDIEFSTEEILAYKWFLKHGVQNKFTEMSASYFGNEINVGIRMFKNFPKTNLPDKHSNFKLSQFKLENSQSSKLLVNIGEVYYEVENGLVQREKQFEEILYEKIKSGKRKIKFNANETIMVEEGMDETQCFTNIVGRTSIFPSRKSMAPFPTERKTIFKPWPCVQEENPNHLAADPISPEIQTGETQNFTPDNMSFAASANLPFPKIFKNLVPLDFNAKTSNEPSTSKSHISNIEMASNSFAPNNISSQKGEAQNFVSDNISFAAPTNLQFPKIFKNVTDSNMKGPSTSNFHVSNVEMEPSVAVNNCPEVNFNFPSAQLQEQQVFKPPFKICEMQEKSPVNNSVLNNENDVKEAASTENKNMDNFVIYEDPDGSFKFKQPRPIKLKPQVPAVEEETEECINTKTPQMGVFAVDETFSTQNFNLFVRAQPASTPIGKKYTTHIKEQINEKVENCIKQKTIDEIEKNGVKSPDVIDNFNEEKQKSNYESNKLSFPLLSKELQCTSSTNIALSTVLNTSPQYNADPQPYKQLSTIMEMSEPNTLAIGSTKSSVDTPGTLSCDPEIIKSVDIKSISNDANKTNKSLHSTYIGNPKIFETVSNTKLSEGVQKTSLVIDDNSFREINKNNETKTKITSVEEENIKYKDQQKNLEKIATNTDNVEKFGKEGGNFGINPKTGECIQINDASQCFNMKSIQIFEEKTETVPKMILKKSREGTPQKDLYDYFAKTPERKAQAYKVQDFNNSLTFSKLNDLTLPKCPENIKFSPKDSPAPKIAKFSFSKGNSEKSSNKFSCVEKSFVSETYSVAKSNYQEDQVSDQLQNDLYNYFVKTPERKGQTAAISKTIEINDSLTFAKLNDLTLPKCPDINKCLPKTSPTPKLVNSLVVEEKYVTPVFDFAQKQNYPRQQPILPNFSDLTLPKLADKESNSFAENKSRIKTEREIVSQTSNKSIHDTKPIDQISLKTHPDIHELSLHIKEEIIETSPNQKLGYEEMHAFSLSEHCSGTQIPPNHEKIEKKIRGVEDIACKEMSSLKITEKDNDCNIQRASNMCDKEENYLGRSIYTKSIESCNTQKHAWTDGDESDPVSDFVHFNPENLDQTNIMIKDKFLDINVNPFSSELTTAFLESIEFTNHIQQLDSCELKGKINKLNAGNDIAIKNKKFTVCKMIGEGTFGTIYSAKEKYSGKMFALKQEKPANLWEYYVCLELRSRVENVDMLPAFMNIEYALIGNNASIYVSQLSPYGSLIAVCNTYKRKTNKNLDEYVVMILTDQILQIIDHLHALKIIHADIKPDNFLLMTKLSYPKNELAVQLIDFGVSIDMELFPKKQTFMYTHEKDDFKCIEMREGRPWTYQTDLYGVAGIIHVLLYGKYMDVHKNLCGIWAPKQRFPRYLKKDIWGPIFQNLLNIPDCELMPNLQTFRAAIGEALFDKEKYVIEKVNDFNLYMSN
ncbi:uncharacterized protein LOC129613385 [Condylostylus longicornis]|uniref:uncharacterized protein LOC129613385 n=1 Tax=Condylostylus longicornis TaxID=2530218 RepID=UPI00244DFA32|nr:uncharacterized protein LOC129613385 [Condylostylus longicornis]